MAILKHIASKSSSYGAALEYLIFKHDELRKTPILDQNGNRIMRDEFYLDGLNCEPYSFDAACQQLNREYQKNKNNIFVKTQRGRYSYLPPERNKFISERSLGESCKRECLEGFFVQNAEKNLRYKEDPILIFTTRTRLRLVVDLQENVKAQDQLISLIRNFCCR